MKRWLRHPAVMVPLSWLAAGYIRLVLLTSRIERQADPAALPYLTGERQAIFAFWHGRMLLLPAFKPKQRSMDVLISLHGDGRAISEIVKRFGIGTVSGSSSKGGANAMRRLLRVLQDGGNISITPDGPRGPNRIAARGISQLALKTGLPVLPVTFSAAHHARLRSWDRFLLAKPFGHIVMAAGAPLAVEGRDMATFRAEVERALNLITDQADRAAGLALEQSATSR